MSILKILIIGSNGFFGKNIKILLQNKNYELICLDRKNVDVLDKVRLNQKFQEIKPDVVINCCGIIGSSHSNKEKKQLDILNTNILLNMNIFECCNFHVVKKVILFSTYRIVSQTIHPCYNEKDLNFININDNHINNGYLMSKKIMQIQSEILKKMDNSMQIISFILPNIFGCHDDFIPNGRIVASLITKITSQNTDDIHIHSHPDTLVNIISINDVVRLLDICIQSTVIDGNIIIFNDKNTMSLEQLANKIKVITNSDKKVIFDSQLSYDTDNSMDPDISKFESIFSNFEYSDLDDCLKETIDFYLQSTTFSKS